MIPNQTKNYYKYIIFLILIVSFVLKFIYVDAVRYDVSPHDLGSPIISEDDIQTGHLGYIQYIATYKSLPDSVEQQFYQPPLFHILAAVVYSLNYDGNDYDSAFECVQTFNMLIACIGIIFLYLIIKKTIKSHIYQVLMVALVAFSPIFYIIGAELNGDCLMTTLSIVAIYATICWNENDTLKNILAIAFSLSFAILAKSSAIMLSPAIGLVFILHFFKGEKTKKDYIKQFIMFLIICCIIAPAWLVRKYVMFDLPFSYVPLLSEDSWQYVGDLSLFERLVLPSAMQLSSVGINGNFPSEYANIWGQTLITENFDEGILIIGDNMIKYGVALLRTTLVLHVFELIAIVVMIKNIIMEKSILKKAVNILFVLSIIVVMLSYVKFAVEYPHICTMNARYIVVSLSMAGISLGIGFENINNTIIKRGWMVVSIILIGTISVLSAFLYYTCAV